MTFLGSFFTDTETLWMCSLSSRSCFPQTVPIKATEKCKSELFSFDFSSPPRIHSYMYVGPISALPKYSGGLRLRGRKKKVWKVLKVLLDSQLYGHHQAGGVSLRGSADAPSRE